MRDRAARVQQINLGPCLDGGGGGHLAGLPADPCQQRHRAARGDPCRIDSHGVINGQSMRFAPLYHRLAASHGAAFFDAGAFAAASALDDVHLDAAGQRALGRALVPVVEDLLT